MPEAPQNTDAIKVPVSFVSANPEPALTPSTVKPETIEPDPAKPAFSPLVEPFDSGGGPPAPEPVETQRSLKTPIIVTLMLAVLAGLGYGAYVYYGPQWGITTLPNSATTSPAATPADSLGAPLRQLDTNIGDLNTNLNDADSTLDDKQGDLSE